MRKHIIIFLLIFPVICIYSIDINNNEPELIKIIEDGDAEGMLKLGFIPPGPTCFYYKNSSYYVCDNWNTRIVIYDNNFNFKKNINLDMKKRKFAPRIIKVDEKYIYILTLYDDFFKLNFNGDILFSENLDIDIFYLINEHIIYYIHSEKKVIDPMNNTLIKKEANEALNKQIGWFNINMNLSFKKKQAVKDFIINKDLIFINSKILNDEFKYHKEYFNLINITEKDMMKIYSIYWIMMITRIVIGIVKHKRFLQNHI